MPVPKIQACATHIRWQRYRSIRKYPRLFALALPLWEHPDDVRAKLAGVLRVPVTIEQIDTRFFGDGWEASKARISIGFATD